MTEAKMVEKWLKKHKPKVGRDVNKLTCRSSKRYQKVKG